MEIIALKEYTDRYISLYEGEIRNINEPLALRLIEQGVVANHEDQQQEEREPNWTLYWSSENDFVNVDALIPESTQVKVIYDGSQFILDSNAPYEYGSYQLQEIIGQFSGTVIDGDFSKYPVALGIIYSDKTGSSMSIVLSPEEQEKYPDSSENSPTIEVYYDDKTSDGNKDNEDKNPVFLTVEITDSHITNFEGTYSDIQEAYLAGKDIKLCVVNGNTHSTKFVPLTFLTFKNDTDPLTPYIFYFRLLGAYCGAGIEWGMQSERRVNYINDFTYIAILYSNPLFRGNGEPEIEIEVQEDPGTKVMDLEIQINSYSFDMDTSTSITSLTDENKNLTNNITHQDIMDALQYYHREIRICLAAKNSSIKYYLYLSERNSSSFTFCSSVIPSEQGSYFYQFKFYEKDDSRNLVTKVSI